MTRRRARTPLAVILLSTIALLAAGCGKEEAAPPSGPVKQYAALGDSYAAGPGIPPVEDAGCYRSGANYGSLVADDLNIPDYADATCGGASSKDLLTGQVTQAGDRINDAQLDAVTKDTDLVTLGIGLNEGGFSVQVMYICLPEINQAAACQAYLNRPDSDLKKALEVIGDRVAGSIKAIRKKAPSARVVLVGYPRMLPVEGECPDVIPLTGKAADRLKQTSLLTSEIFKVVAEHENADYIDMYTPSVGHDACSKDPWVNGIENKSTTGEGAALHPTPTFMREVADRIDALVTK